MKTTLETFARRQLFFPGVPGLFISPFFLARRALWKRLLPLAHNAKGSLLDVGCGTKPYRSLFDVQEYIGLEIDSPFARQRGVADAFYDGTRFPFPDSRFDVVLCNQVLEHVFNPQPFTAELRRVLRPGGQLILTMPFVWDEHEQPHDFGRYTSFGLRAILEEAGFEIASHDRTLGDASILFQLLNTYLYKVISPRRRATQIVVSSLIFAPISALGWLVGKLLPDNPDLYLDHVIVGHVRAKP